MLAPLLWAVAASPMDDPSAEHQVALQPYLPSPADGAYLDALGEPVAFEKPRCFEDGAKVAFIAVENKSSAVMRGWVTAAVLKKAFDAQASVLLLDGAHNAKERLGMLQQHFVAKGDPTVCIILKHPSLEAVNACRKRGALVLLDCIDNPQCSSEESLSREEFRRVDALLVQTRAHKRTIEGLGMRAGLWPHSHGNFRGWGLSGPRTEKIRHVGIVVGDPVHNMPDNATLQMLSDVCCKHGAKLWLVLSEQAAEAGQAPPPLRLVNPMQAPSGYGPLCDADSKVATQCRAESSLEVPEPIGSEHEFSAQLRKILRRQDLRDAPVVQGQRIFYEDQTDDDGFGIRLRDMDVGLLWAPTQRMTTDGPFATFNRPPTRLFWWFSHGTPVIAHSMQAYLEAAQIIGYPKGLMHVDSGPALDEALCSIANQDVRGKLQRLSRYGASLSSPLLSASTLMQQVCVLAEDLGMTRKGKQFIREKVRNSPEEPTSGHPRTDQQESHLELFFPSPLECTSAAQCALDFPVLRGSFAEAAKRTFEYSASCTNVVYTVFFDARGAGVQAEAARAEAARAGLGAKAQGKAAKAAYESGEQPLRLPQPLGGSTDCAFAFVYKGTKTPPPGPPPDWIYVEVDVDELPWPAEQFRRNSRVPKMLPHLFFPPSVRSTIYLDAENSVAANVTEVLWRLLGSCDAGFAAQAHKNRAINVMEEFAAIKRANNSAEPRALDAQWLAYRLDADYRDAVRKQQAVGIDGEFLVRRNNHRHAQLLSEAWMRAYLRGADRDQPSFSFAVEKSVLGPCRREAQRLGVLHDRDNPPCGLTCGQGFINLVGHAASTDCQRWRAGTPKEEWPEDEHDEFTRPPWSQPPPELICRSMGLVEAVQPLLSQHLRERYMSNVRPIPAGNHPLHPKHPLHPSSPEKHPSIRARARPAVPAPRNRAALRDERGHSQSSHS